MRRPRKNGVLFSIRAIPVCPDALWIGQRPATYSRLVAKALQHLPSSEVLCYLDDTAVHSEDAWSHLSVIRKVLTAFRSAGCCIEMYLHQALSSPM